MRDCKFGVAVLSGAQFPATAFSPDSTTRHRAIRGPPQSQLLGPRFDRAEACCSRQARANHGCSEGRRLACGDRSSTRLMETRMSQRIAFRMNLNPGQAAEYKKRHDEIWPELSAALRHAGVSDYWIWLDPETN